MSDLANEEADGPMSYTTNVTGSPILVTGVPKILDHPYLTDQIDGEVPLAKPRFLVDKFKGGPFTGAIYLRWKPRLELIAAGSRPAHIDDLDTLIATPDSRWIKLPIIEFASNYTAKEIIESSKGHDVSSTTTDEDLQLADRVQSVEVGVDDDLDEVRFLIPNNYEAYDGFHIHVVDEDALPWRARAEIDYAGWRIRIDRAPHTDRQFVRDLQQSRGFGFTNIGRITRLNRDHFQASDALEILAQLGLALSLMVGRRTGCMLPIGYKSGEPVWLEWNYIRVDPAGNSSSFADPSIANTQLMELANVLMHACADPFKQRVLTLCMSYLIQANSHLDAELSVGASISGLSLLSHTILVAESKAMSSSAFGKPGQTEVTIRQMLDMFSIPTELPQNFPYLATVSQDLQQRDEKVRDGLACVVKMRHEVMHPKMDHMASWTGYQWIECAIIAQYYLETALLAWLGYQGRYHSRIDDAVYVGATSPVPWNIP
jgi:hypothetical protein